MLPLPACLLGLNPRLSFQTGALSAPARQTAQPSELLREGRYKGPEKGALIGLLGTLARGCHRLPEATLTGEVKRPPPHTQPPTGGRLPALAHGELSPSICQQAGAWHPGRVGNIFSGQPKFNLRAKCRAPHVIRNVPLPAP